LAGEGCTTAADASDSLGRMDGLACRELLSSARVRAGLPSISEVEGAELVEYMRRVAASESGASSIACMSCAALETLAAIRK